MAADYKTPVYASAVDNLPFYVRIALNIFMSFVQGTIKNPNSPKAQMLKGILVAIVDTINQFLQAIP